MSERALKIAVTGTRGIPGIQGGVETHCERLYPRLAAMGFDVTLYRRKPCVAAPSAEFEGVKLRDLPAPRRKSLEAIVHTFRAILDAGRSGADVVHIHAVGPALLTPFGRLLGMKVVLTHHGADYDRAKWGRFARFMLKLGERMAARYADAVIAITPQIAAALRGEYGCEAVVIPNGVESPQKCEAGNYLRNLSLAPGRYVVALGRLVPEKNFHLLIDAWRKAAPCGYRLVIAGDAHHGDAYAAHLRELAAEAGVVMPGFVCGRPLCELMGNAALFVMPSAHEGLPIALLEAMSYGLDVLTSDIPACMLPQLTPADHFSCGDTDALAAAITRKLSSPARRSYDLGSYDWNVIAQATAGVYSRLRIHHGRVR